MGYPEKDVVVGGPALLELDDPLVLDLDPPTGRPADRVLDVAADLALVPLDLGPVGQRDQDRVATVPVDVPDGLCVGDDDPAHPG